MYKTSNSVYGNYYTKNIFNNKIKYKTEILNIKNIKDCSICMENKSNLARKFYCGHYYHIKCIDKWLINNKTCPMCRRNLY